MNKDVKFQFHPKNNIACVTLEISSLSSEMRKSPEWKEKAEKEEGK